MTDSHYGHHEHGPHPRAILVSLLTATVAALLVASVASVPAALAQQIPPGSAPRSGGVVALPGFPGAPHIYHIGATDFFLGHSGTIRLTPDQQVALNGIKVKSIAELGAAHRKINQAEQELWTLTGTDQPDAVALETKVREIERLKGDRRIAFIRSVGEAARLLSNEQRALLSRTGAPGMAPATAPQDPSGSTKPNPGMGAPNATPAMPAMGDDSMGGMVGGIVPNTTGPPASAGHLGHHPGGGAASVPGAQGMTTGTPMSAPAAATGAPGMAASAPMAAPVTTPGAPSAAGMASMAEMMGQMMAPAAAGGCMGAGCGSGASLTPIYPTLMTLPALTPEKRAEIDALASQQISEGMERLTGGVESIYRATQVGDDAAAQESVGVMREGLDELGAGIAARRVLSEGKAPRNLALDWFKREMNLASPIAREEPHGFLGFQPFHLFTMVLMIAFALAMIAMYFFKMRRAAALFGRIEPDSGAPPPRAPPPPPGAPGPPSPASPPGGAAPPPAVSTSPATPAVGTPPSPNASSGGSSAALAPEGASVPPLTANWRGQLRIGGIATETPSVKTFRLLPSSGDGLIPFTFVPGQFLNVAFWIGGAKMNRSYSISSSPTRRDHIELTVRREPRGAVSRHIVDLLEVGDPIEGGGPIGKFTFSGTEADSIVLIAGGVGITPMMSITRYLTERSWGGEIFLVYACRAPTDFIFANEVAALQRVNPKLHVVVTMSRPDGTDWKGPRGRVTKELLTQAIPDLASRRIHLCGPPSMMDATKAILVELGVPPDRLKTEAFGATKPTPAALGTSSKPTVPATGPLVTFSKNNKAARIRTGQTVLELSEELAIGIEFSCRVGTCGICKVKMTSGEVEMAVDDALDEEDKVNGIILACQAMPKGEIAVEA